MTVMGEGRVTIFDHYIYVSGKLYLPLPLAKINTVYFSLKAKCWLRGGLGDQFPRNV